MWLRITVTGEALESYDDTGELPIGETEDRMWQLLDTRCCLGNDVTDTAITCDHEVFEDKGALQNALMGGETARIGRSRRNSGGGFH